MTLKHRHSHYISSVETGSPAALGGLKKSDRIVEVNGQNVEDADHMELVELMKRKKKSMRLLVVDVKTDLFYRQEGIVISGELEDVVKVESPGDMPRGMFRQWEEYERKKEEKKRRRREEEERRREREVEEEESRRDRDVEEEKRRREVEMKKIEEVKRKEERKKEIEEEKRRVEERKKIEEELEKEEIKKQVEVERRKEKRRREIEEERYREEKRREIAEKREAKRRREIEEEKYREEKRREIEERRKERRKEISREKSSEDEKNQRIKSSLRTVEPGPRYKVTEGKVARKKLKYRVKFERFVSVKEETMRIMQEDRERQYRESEREARENVSKRSSPRQVKRIWRVKDENKDRNKRYIRPGFRLTSSEFDSERRVFKVQEKDIGVEKYAGLLFMRYEDEVKRKIRRAWQEKTDSRGRFA